MDETWKRAAPAGRPTLPRAVALDIAGLETVARILAAVMLCCLAARPWLAEAAGSEERPAGAAAREATTQASDRGRPERVVSGYVAQPFYRRSDVQLVRPDGTDLTLRQLGWDGDALHPPIDGGVRAVSWRSGTGLMLDFLHNKAIARLGKGAHGSRVAKPVIETVDATGTLAGQPAPPRILLTDLFERFEFTHGHNVLLLTPLLRLPSAIPGVRPYVGAGAGLAMPHVEVWAAGDPRERRTNEYQLAGPAAQLVAGFELRVGRLACFVEYKLSWAWISGALTGDHSRLSFDAPGDLLRQLRRWWRSEEPRLGRFTTSLVAHQIAGGIGWRLGATAAPPTHAP